MSLLVNLSKCVVRIGAAIAVACATASCTTLSPNSKPLSLALDELTSEGTYEDSEFLHFKRFISVSGVVPEHAPLAYFHQPQFGWSTNTSPSNAIGVSPDWSFVVHRLYPMTALDGGTTSNALRVLQFRDAIEGLRDALAEVATRRLIVTLAAQKLKDGGEQALDADSLRFLGALLGVELDANGKDEKAPKKVAQTKIDEINADIVAKLAAIPKLRDDLRQKSQIANVLVARWEREDKGDAVVRLMPLASADTSGSKKTTGLVVLGELRVSTLYAGADLFQAIASMNPTLSGNWLEKISITTFMLQARHIAYVSDLSLEDSFVARLSLTKDQLRQFAQALKEVSLDLSLTLGMSQDLGNNGMLSSSIVDVKKQCFWSPDAHSLSMQEEIKAANGYGTVMAIRVEPKSKLIAAGKAVWEDLRPEYKAILEKKGIYNLDERDWCDKWPK